ncbi:MAG: phytanoyl-CoA dioxygenase family protein [Cytophagales bacterium]|nr:phytanoyl-CoA dioxygenase family protein [Armatimonadota bacterium]
MSLTAVREETSETGSPLADQFARDGYAVARGLFSPQEIAEIRETFMAQAASGPVEGLSDGNHKSLTPDDPLSWYPRMMHPHRHPELPVGPLSARYLLDDRLHRLLAEFLGEEPVAAQSMFYFKPAGARGQELHQDNFYLRVQPGTCCAAWIAVDDADEENGGMMVVPGSNDLEIACPQKADAARSFTSDYVPVPEGMEATPVTLQAGDVLFFNGSVIHGSYPNTSRDRFRRSLIFHYVPETSEALSNHYASLRFDGTPVAIPAATGGGPCGTSQPMGPH